jgi:hypothetical protein
MNNGNLPDGCIVISNQIEDPMPKEDLLKNHFLFFLLGILFLVGCETVGAPASGISTDSSLTYQREGGLAGINQEWIILPDGRIIAPDGEEMQVPPQEAVDLLSRSAEIEPASTSISYVAGDECCDQFFYTIIIKVGDQEITLQTSDGANHPESITSLIEDIEQLISMAEPAE